MTQPNEQRIFKTILLPFASYLFTFVGMGIVAGSVVHFGRTDQIPRFLGLGILGMVMFVLSSYIQESRLNGSTVQKGGTLRYVFYSLILAIGIGMISGGTQHFLDFPVYASYLLPVGFVLALVAYVIRNNLDLTRKGWSFLLGGALLLALPTFFGLNLYAQALPVSAGHHGEEQPAASSPAAQMQSNVEQDTVIKSDDDFISGMIAHHQEAIAMAQQVQGVTERSDLKEMASDIIRIQSQEVSQLQRLGSEYSPKSSPKPHDNADGHTH
jgi:hypothetical protein